MKGRARAMFLICAGVALLATPQAASAKSGYYVSKPSRFEMLHFKGNSGYKIDLFSLDAKYVILQARRFDGSTIQAASYIVPGQASEPDEIHAAFGKLGRVSLRFRPSGPPKIWHEPGSECKGRGPAEQKGHFVGSFRFHGERGFTSVRTTSAKGEVFRRFKQVCKRPDEPKAGGAQPKAVSLSAHVEGDPGKPSFNAYELLPGSSFGPESANYFASLTERKGRMTITRSATAFAKPSTFVVSDPGASPATATVAPPFPFSGTASFERSPGSAAAWSGDLSADLPGLGTVALTGPSFAAELCRDLSCSCPPATRCAFFTFGESRSTAARLQRPAPRP